MTDHDKLRAAWVAELRDAHAQREAFWYDKLWGWQPIESVTLDETVMLWSPVQCVCIGHVTSLAGCEYTHWMPLPKPPIIDGQRQR
jgi:hypothetical protein